MRGCNGTCAQNSIGYAILTEVIHESLSCATMWSSGRPCSHRRRNGTGPSMSIRRSSRLRSLLSSARHLQEGAPQIAKKGRCPRILMEPSQALPHWLRILVDYAIICTLPQGLSLPSRFFKSQRSSEEIHVVGTNTKAISILRCDRN